MSKKTKSKGKKQSDSPIAQIARDARQWCKGRMWWPRLLLMLLFFHLLMCHIKDPLYSDIFKGINLGFHEIGHVVFNPFGEFIGVAGGSIFQCLVPLLSTIMFYRQRDYFGIAFCLAWLSTNLFDVATYAADARALELPLVTPFKGGEETIHDWNYILDKMDMLQYDAQIAFGLRTLAVLSMLTFFAMGGWLVFHMANTKPAKRSVSQESGEAEAAPQIGWQSSLPESIKLNDSVQDKSNR